MNRIEFTRVLTRSVTTLFIGAVLASCGGGGGSSTPASGTAAQYFTKKAVGNTWSSMRTSTNTFPGQPTSTNTSTLKSTITVSTSAGVTYSDTFTSNGVTSPAATATTRLDATGAWVLTEESSETFTILPATFSVGTTWVSSPANSANGTSGTNATVAAFNVTRTVPAGTFTDCIQIDWIGTQKLPSSTMTTTSNGTYYLSPTIGWFVEDTESSSSTDGSTGTSTSQLQAGYIANP